MANTWGTNYYGVNEFGLQDEINQSVTGSSVTSSISSVTVQADSNVFPNTNLITSFIGDATEDISVDVFAQGVSATAVTGLADANPDANVIGSSLQVNTNDVTIPELGLIGSGWGRDLWGSLVWGDNYSVQTGSVSAQTAINAVTTQIDVDVQVQGQQLLVVTGNETPQANANVFPTGINIQSNIGQVQGLTIQGSQMNTGVGVVDIQAGANIYVNVTEHTINTFIGLATEDISVDVYPTGLSLTTNIGDETAFTDVEVSLTGIPLTTSIGNETAFTDVVVSVTGQQLTVVTGNENAFTDVTVSVTGSEITGNLGNITPISIYNVDGILATTSIGSVTVQANADVNVTGSGLTVNTITPNIIAWAEVDTGTDVVWTPVDLAA